MTVNIYSPTDLHLPAYILGDREGLEKLKVAIEQALADGRAESSDFDSDGEGCAVRVMLTTEEKLARIVAPILWDEWDSSAEVEELWRSYDYQPNHPSPSNSAASRSRCSSNRKPSGKGSGSG